MGDILGILVLVVFYAVAASSSKKKRRQRAQSRQERVKAREARFDQAFAGQKNPPDAGKAHSAPSEKGFGTPDPERRLEYAQEGEDPCHEGRLRPAQPHVRLSNASPSAMARAGEGEDPCHEVRSERTDRTDHAASEDAMDLPAPDREELARQMLAGVVMSEVLKRPAERMMERKLRRRA